MLNFEHSYPRILFIYIHTRISTKTYPIISWLFPGQSDSFFNIINKYQQNILGGNYSASFGPLSETPWRGQRPRSIIDPNSWFKAGWVARAGNQSRLVSWQRQAGQDIARWLSWLLSLRMVESSAGDEPDLQQLLQSLSRNSVCLAGLLYLPKLARLIFSKLGYRTHLRVPLLCLQLKYYTHRLSQPINTDDTRRTVRMDKFQTKFDANSGFER